jgi:hypothetical protein
VRSKFGSPSIGSATIRRPAVEVTDRVSRRIEGEARTVA